MDTNRNSHIFATSRYTFWNWTPDLSISFRIWFVKSASNIMAQQNFEMDLMCNTKTTNQIMNGISKVSRE